MRKRLLSDVETLTQTLGTEVPERIALNGREIENCV